MESAPQVASHAIPSVFPFEGHPEQPRPIQFFLGEMSVGGERVKAITRIFAPGQSRLCRLCPSGECGADHELGVCQVLTARPVTAESAPLFVSRPDDARSADHVARSG